jgi:hypothetical protein
LYYLAEGNQFVSIVFIRVISAIRGPFYEIYQTPASYSQLKARTIANHNLITLYKILTA